MHYDGNKKDHEIDSNWARSFQVRWEGKPSLRREHLNCNLETKNEPQTLD